MGVDFYHCTLCANIVVDAIISSRCFYNGITRNLIEPVVVNESMVCDDCISKLIENGTIVEMTHLEQVRSIMCDPAAEIEPDDEFEDMRTFWLMKPLRYAVTAFKTFDPSAQT